MTLQIHLLTPSPSEPPLSLPSDEGIDEFEMRGTWEEVFMLGKNVPLASLKVPKSTPLLANEIWASLELVHLHATRDHLVLIDPEIVQIRPEEEQGLRQSVQEVLDYYIQTEVISMGNAWLFRAEHFKSLKTSSVHLAKGRNIDVWMPKDTDQVGVAKKWRQLQNEIQMIWHDHPINLARYERGELPINSVWLQGIGSLEQIQPHSAVKDADFLHSNALLARDLASSLGKSCQPVHVQGLRNLKTGTHFIDGRSSMNAAEWEVVWQEIWQTCLGFIASDKLTTLNIYTEFANQTLHAQLNKSDIQLGFMERLLSYKRQYRYPTWQESLCKIKWQTSMLL